MFRYAGQNERSDLISLYSETTNQFNIVKKLLLEFKENEIVDFDDHFLDTNLDWRNKFVEDILNKLN
jgi:hypothetical protein